MGGYTESSKEENRWGDDGGRGVRLTQERVTAVRYKVGEGRNGRLYRYGLGDVRRDLGGHYRAGIDGRVCGLGTERELEHPAVGLGDHGLGDDGRGRDGE